jgi:hypothetical protein
MTQEFTPSLTVIREMFAHADSRSYEDSVAAFDRALAAHDAQIREDAWDEGFTEGRDLAISGKPMTRHNPYKEQQR